MKKIFICLMMAFTCATMSAEVKVEGNTYTEVKTSKSENIKTEFKYKDKDGVEYPIYLSKNGRAYINKVSKNGNEYKKYLGEEISRDICEKLGKEYVETKKSN